MAESSPRQGVMTMGSVLVYRRAMTVTERCPFGDVHPVTYYTSPPGAPLRWNTLGAWAVTP